MNLKIFLAVFLLGGLGSTARWAISEYTQWPSIGVNIIGSFLIGLCFSYFSSSMEHNPVLHTSIMIGFLGGLTTFSTFSLELLKYAEQGDFIKLSAYALLSVSLSLLAAFAGTQSFKLIS